MILKRELSDFRLIEQALEDMPMPVPMMVTLALEEAFVNIVSYSGCTEIGFEAISEQGQLLFVFTDDGVEFDPTQVPPPPPITDVTELKCGGLGIDMIRKIMHFMGYERTGMNNKLTLKYNYED